MLLVLNALTKAELVRRPENPLPWLLLSLLVKPTAGLCAHFDGLGRCAVRGVPRHVIQTPEMCVDCYSTITKLRRQGPPLRTLECGWKSRGEPHSEQE
jgi:hypothetical protein